MIRPSSVIKWILLIAASTLPFALNMVFYQGGAMDDLFLFLPVFAVLTTLNFICLKKPTHFIFMQVYILLWEVFSGLLATFLYYFNISSDFMTPVVCILLTAMGAGIILDISTILAVIKAVLYQLKAKRA